MSVFVVARSTGTARRRPAVQNAVKLEAEVIMRSRGIMLLDEEPLPVVGLVAPEGTAIFAKFRMARKVASVGIVRGRCVRRAIAKTLGRHLTIRSRRDSFPQAPVRTIPIPFNG